MERLARDLSVSDTSLSFQGPGILTIGPHFNWEILLPVSRGELRFDWKEDSIRVHYSVYYTTFVVWSTGLALLGATVVGVEREQPSVGMHIFFFFWAIVCGANLLISVARLRAYFRRIVEQSLKEVLTP